MNGNFLSSGGSGLRSTAGLKNDLFEGLDELGTRTAHIFTAHAIVTSIACFRARVLNIAILGN
jgi:hypothetical protein